MSCSESGNRILLQGDWINPLDLHVVGIIQRVQTGVLTWTDLGSGKGDSA